MDVVVVVVVVAVAVAVIVWLCMVSGTASHTRPVRVRLSACVLLHS